MRALCVFLGSSPGTHPAYAEAAIATGREIARRGLTCVYGGSNTGLMRLLADSALAAGGRVIGVTIEVLRARERHHTGLTELHVVPTMHERKALMAELADGFIALPGGIGTFEEFFEVYTHAQLGFHAKPCGLLSVNDYYAPLDALLDNAEREGFLRASHRTSIFRAATPEALISRMLAGQVS